MSFIKTIGAMFCYGWMPLYFGGGGKSQANTSTATTTNTSQVNTDQSMMGGDGAVGINGMGNIVDQSVINNTAFNDNSNKSTNFSDTSNRSTNFSDSSTRTTIFTDSSDSSSSVQNTTTDFGSVSRSLDGMTQLSSLAVNNSAAIIKNGLDSVAGQSKENIAVLSKAFEFASKSSAADAQKYTDVLGFAKDSITKASDEYANAKDGGQNKTLMIAAVAVVGAVGLAFALKA